jgi:DNA-binding MarR family transcriptional regulator
MTESHPLSDHIGFVLRRAQLSVFQDFQQAVDGLDLTPAGYSVLVILGRHPGMRQNKLTELLALKPANCVTLINGLEKRGLVVREKVKVSGRAVALSLTEDGHLLLAKADDRVDAHMARMRERLGEADAARLLALLHKLVASGGEVLADTEL